MSAPRGHTNLVVFGRRAVLEAIASPNVEVRRVIVAREAPSEFRRELAGACEASGIELRSRPRPEVGAISREPRHDQGVCAEVTLRLVSEVDQFIDSLSGPRAANPTRVLALDGITNPQNIGQIIRSARAAGIDAILWPLEGSPWIDGLVVKSSASTVFDQPIARTESLALGLGALQGAGFRVVGLDAGATLPLMDYAPAHRVAMVMGSETTGLSPESESLLDERVRIPMAPGVESLNVSAAATLVCFHLAQPR